MSGWAGGYVADIEYVSSYYRQQSAPQMALAGLLAGIDTRLPGGEEDAHYLELGCGHGLNAVLTAASNPGWRVTAVDYNPLHIASGRALAREAGVGNVRFLEADFGDRAAMEGIAMADYVSMHGVWSWVSPGVRSGIVRLLRDVVAPGGLVHVSYNALPAWQGALGVQRLVFEAGRRTQGRSDQQVQQGLALAGAMMEAGGRHLRIDPFVAKLLEGGANAPILYLAHEYMNAHWSPCFHADVAGAMAEAKLEWGASCNPLETFPDLMLSAPQRAIYDAAADPVMKELVKDICLPRQLRHDVFVRGARRLGNAARDALLRGVTLALSVPAEDVVFEMDVPVGQAELGAAFRPMVAALAEGPRTVGALLALTPGHSSAAEVPGILVGTGQAIVVARPGVAASEGLRRANRAIGGRVVSVSGAEMGGGLASEALGAGFPVPRLVQFVCGRMLAGEDEGDLEGWFARLRVDVPEAQHGTLRGMIEGVVAKQVPLLRQVGVLPG